MNVLIVSQCTKNATKETRRIMDQFAERKGDKTWQTQITEQGLRTLRKLLREKARRNTAICCYWLRGKKTDVLWMVGNTSKFNDKGTVPTNSTLRDILRDKDEDTWQYAQDIIYAASIAGLFHDFGKANVLFQKKISPGATKSYEPLRHEWLSYQLFLAFIRDCETDSDWVKKLAEVSDRTEEELMRKVKNMLGEKHGKDKREAEFELNKDQHPFGELVGWLILTHHLIPVHPKVSDLVSASDARALRAIGTKKTRCRGFGPDWNSPRTIDFAKEKKDIDSVWNFKAGTPFKSKTWRMQAQKTAPRALRNVKLEVKEGEQLTASLDNRFVAHLARLVLMLADHCVSSEDPNTKLQDPDYNVYANSVRETGELKQRLDEHNIGVAEKAGMFAARLSRARDTMPALPRIKALKKHITIEKYRWQNKAREVASHVAPRTLEQGFFGLNMASTGRGKTFANAMIMHALDDDRKKCRFSIVLGLRVLTEQTAQAIQDRLKLPEDCLAKHVGSMSIPAKLKEENAHVIGSQSLHELSGENSNVIGSESLADFEDDGEQIYYEGSIDEVFFGPWLKDKHNITKGFKSLVSAPILVSTIDYLMPATEMKRGNKQMAAMLRLLTADLVIDEPDDFNLEDLPALCRLVHMAGLLGARMLLSSATLPPSIVEAMFKAYCTGRTDYNRACGHSSTEDRPVVCAWFDEFTSSTRDCYLDAGPTAGHSFEQAHLEFVTARVQRLESSKVIARRAKIVDIEICEEDEDTYSRYASTIYSSILALHDQTKLRDPVTNRAVSIGLVRFANIEPMLKVARRLIALSVRQGTVLHLCIYHSQFPQLIRAKIERAMDSLLSRHDAKAIWRHKLVAQAINAAHPNPVDDADDRKVEHDHVFVVFGTAVTEVGRDHDYDWAIVEPSSMRSIIQLAGRVQRHREQTVSKGFENIVLLANNIKALEAVQSKNVNNESKLAFTHPGFESADAKLLDHDLRQALTIDQYAIPSSIPRLLERSELQVDRNLVDLEHHQIRKKLLSATEGNLYASLWWQEPLHWCFELQRLQPFRSSQQQTTFRLAFEYENDAELTFQERGEDREHPWNTQESKFNRCDEQELLRNKGIKPWMDLKPIRVVRDKAEELRESEYAISRRYMQFTLRSSTERWQYSDWFGLFAELGE